MQLATVSSQFFTECKNHGTDKELFCDKAGRPCVLIINLIYKWQSCAFVVPLRSNISANAPKDQYFALPPNASTQSGKRHGVHYIKMFPIDKKYIQPYKISKSGYLVMLKGILDKNESKIINACQEYLDKYEKGLGSPMTPDIDGILSWLQNGKVMRRDE